MFEQLKIKKWWWENAAEFKKSPDNILKDFEKKINQIVVVSAVRSTNFNTTDNLIELAWLLNNNSLEDAYNKILEIQNFHLEILKEKLWDNSEIESFINEFFINYLWKTINDWINFNGEKIYPNKDNDYSIWFWDKYLSLIWIWEELSALIQEKLIKNLNIDWLDAQVVDLNWLTNDITEADNESIVFEKLSKQIKSKVDKILTNWKVAVIPGYIPGFEEWIENRIGRWYTDATASMTAIWFSESYDVILEIQKSVKWMLSADPRIVDNPKLIEQIDYLTAKEITWVRWSQAKLLHSQVLRKELLKKWIKVRLFDPFSDSKWTIISKTKNPESSWVEYVGARDNVIFFSISSWNMSDYWVLAKVFEVVKSYGISVDIVSTSETEISFTIDNWISDELLKDLVDDIKNELDIDENDEVNFVKYSKNKALIFCIGQNLAQSIWALDKATNVLSKNLINIELMSQWAMERSMIFGIDAFNMKKAVKLLHNEFIK
jgi:aspartate kinase